MARIEWTKAAKKDLENIDKIIVMRILRKISWFADNFGRITPEPLSGEFRGTFKFRIGNWRAIYIIENDTIVIHFVGHRRDIYEIR